MCFLIDDPSLCVPFSELSGESVEWLGKCTDALLAISNFRFFAHLQHAFINVSSFDIDTCCDYPLNNPPFHNVPPDPVLYVLIN